MTNIEGWLQVGEHGFGDVLVKGLVVADPSRVAAQIVSGIGFIGAGLIVVLAFQPAARRLPRSSSAVSLLRISYPDGRGLLCDVLRLATDHGFAVDELATVSRGDGYELTTADGQRAVEVLLHVHGKGSLIDLAARLSELPSVQAVASDDANVPIED